MQIRVARPEDAAGIAELLRVIEWFSHLREQTFEDNREQVARQLVACQTDNSHVVYVAEENGKVVGYVSLHLLPYLFLPGPEGYVSELFVSEQVRGQGIGTQLLEAIQTEALARGCMRLRLVNNKARESYQRKFYEKHDWIERDDLATMEYSL